MTYEDIETASAHKRRIVELQEACRQVGTVTAWVRVGAVPVPIPREIWQQAVDSEIAENKAALVKLGVRFG